MLSILGGGVGGKKALMVQHEIWEPFGVALELHSLCGNIGGSDIDLVHA